MHSFCKTNGQLVCNIFANILGKNMIGEQCEGMYCLDLASSFSNGYSVFTRRIWLQYRFNILFVPSYPPVPSVFEDSPVYQHTHHIFIIRWAQKTPFLHFCESFRRLATSRFHRFSDVDTVFYLSIYLIIIL